MPALRHDLAGSVSVLRMALAVITRKLETSGDTVDCQAILQRTSSLETGITDLSNGLRRLRHWDKPTDERIVAPVLLGEIWELSRPFLLLRNIEQTPLPQESAVWSALALKPQPLMYVALAAIYHLAEGADTTPQRIIAEPDAHRIRILSEGQAPPLGLPDFAGAPSPVHTPPSTAMACNAWQSNCKAALNSRRRAP
ncbi:hypothetical protein [Diaphorobacter aerolatus]|uniref:Uncharacterized protein n=1 Tax=Diaphorobacter aerolatus TaxID=1288495 RepID=A0A7H0GIA8_9BURK|nr:hypothetical protein [Diaphorobacter aerolatus]QNP48024.1 hypothetical protein H9K75_18340 [Diaphorobacter aerolatus]